MACRTKNWTWVLQGKLWVLTTGPPEKSFHFAIEVELIHNVMLVSGIFNVEMTLSLYKSLGFGFSVTVFQKVKSMGGEPICCGWSQILSTNAASRKEKISYEV